MKYEFPILSLCVLLLVSACVDRKFDEPPFDDGTVDITPNATIQDLKAFHVPGQFVTIEDELILRVVVIADDASGNFFKTLIVQDETAGIELKLNSIGLHNQYPIGRELFIFCKDLVISDFNNLIQLGGGTFINNSGNPQLAGIEEILIGQHVVAGKRDQFVTPRARKINEITLSDLSMLIHLEEVEFEDSHAGAAYANAATQSAINRTLQDCDGRTIILRTSGFANFAGSLTPTGNGSMMAVLGVFGSTLQLLIRDPSDIKMDGDRCDGGPTDPGLPDIISQNFESVGNQQDVNLEGWYNLALEGSRVWRGRTFDGNTYVQATAFQDNAATMEVWLITPAFNLNIPKKLQFRTAVSFYNHQSTEVLISTDFNGNNLTAATWTPLSVTLAGQGNANFEWVDSGEIDLSNWSGAGHIAWRYRGSGPGGQTTTFVLDDVLIDNK
jgi:hypothetical protein